MCDIFEKKLTLMNLGTDHSHRDNSRLSPLDRPDKCSSGLSTLDKAGQCSGDLSPLDRPGQQCNSGLSPVDEADQCNSGLSPLGRPGQQCNSGLSPVDEADQCNSGLSPLGRPGQQCSSGLSPVDKAGHQCSNRLSPLDKAGQCSSRLSPLDKVGQCNSELSPVDTAGQQCNSGLSPLGRPGQQCSSGLSPVDKAGKCDSQLFPLDKAGQCNSELSPLHEVGRQCKSVLSPSDKADQQCNSGLSPLNKTAQPWNSGLYPLDKAGQQCNSGLSPLDKHHLMNTGTDHSHRDNSKLPPLDRPHQQRNSGLSPLDKAGQRDSRLSPLDRPGQQCNSGLSPLDKAGQCGGSLQPQDCVHGVLRPAGSNAQWIISHAQTGAQKFLGGNLLDAPTPTAYYSDGSGSRKQHLRFSHQAAGAAVTSSKGQQGQTAAALYQSFPPFASSDSAPHSTHGGSGSGSGSGHPYDATVKVILLGDYSVGKTSMLRSLSMVKDENGCGCCCEFRPGELVTTILKRDRKRSLVKVMDTGGQEKYRSMTASYYRGVHGCLLVFDVTREDTFANIINWHQDLNQYSGNQFVTSILVGTTSHPAPRAVTPERAFKMAESLGVMYLECDVKDDVMITVIIQRLLDTVIRAGLRKVSTGIEIKPQEGGPSKAKAFCSC